MIVENFELEISKILSDCIINFYEKTLINRLINFNYFYYTADEKKAVRDNCNELLLSEGQELNRHTIITEEIFNYIKNSKIIVLDGIVNFRLPNYIEYLDSIIEFAVKKLIIENEYAQFIDTLKNYIFSTPSKVDQLHLVCINNEFILLDKYHNLINLSTIITLNPELSDIPFSNNDYILNTLLSLLPKKLYVHLAQEEHNNNDSNNNSEFLTTITKIFSNRLSICKNCNICNFISTEQTKHNS